MDRRSTVGALLALSALALPLRSLSQNAGLRKIGILGISNLEPGLGYLREGLRELGYVEGRNIVIEVRSAEERPGALPAAAAELVALKPDLIVAFLTPVVQAAMKATSTIPIVMGSSGDPVASRLVASLARPGGNVTGVANTTAQLAGKILELVREIRPATQNVAVLANATDPFTPTFVGQVNAAGRGLGIAVHPVPVRGPAEYDAAFQKWAATRIDAVILQPSLPREHAIELSLKHKLIAVAPNRPFVEAGGLLSYASNTRDRSRAAASYVDKILKGAKPADLPVEQPTVFELVVNLRTAKALGVRIPQSILARADEVIE